MTDQEIQNRRNVEFQTALENLINRYGFDLTAPYSHSVDGLQIAGNAQLRVNPRSGWQPPADWLSPAPSNDTAGDSSAVQGDIVNESNPQVTKEKKEGK